MPSADLLVYPGFAPESIKTVGDTLVVEGWLLRFSDENSPDLAGDYFTKSTDFGALSDLGTVDVGAFYDHGLDPEVKGERIGSARLELRDPGIWARYQIKRRLDYLRRIADAAKAEGLDPANAFGQSSGAASHLVDRAGKGRARHVTQWVLAEASITPTPCEPTTGAEIKSLSTLFPAGSDAPAGDGSDLTASALKALRDLRAEIDTLEALRALRRSL